MTNSLENSYRALAIPYFLEVFQIIEAVMQQHGFPYYLIGVNAISLQLAKDGHRPSRGTKDIDFAIMVPTFEAYENIRQALITKGFNAVQLPYTLYHPEYNVVIDLLPFGEIAENDTINFHEREVDIVVLGFQETLQEAEAIPLTEPLGKNSLGGNPLGDTPLVVKVPPLHGMCVLKLIAWSDRPEHRGTDLEDIYHIIQLYFEHASDEIYAEHLDLLELEPFDEKRIAARVLGRKIAPVLAKSEKLEKRILSVLEQNMTDTERSKIAEHWARNYHLTIEDALQLLKALREGIADGSPGDAAQKKN